MRLSTTIFFSLTAYQSLAAPLPKQGMREIPPVPTIPVPTIPAPVMTIGYPRPVGGAQIAAEMAPPPVFLR